MTEKEFYATILGIPGSWDVTEVKIDTVNQRVDVYVELNASATISCPECSTVCPGYDSTIKSWRHLDTMQYATYLHARMPRANCPTHGVKLTHAPWAEPGSHFTALFEVKEINLLKETSILAVTRLTDVTWDEAAGIQERAVNRGLARREEISIEHMTIDEISFQRRHEYTSIICDSDKKKVWDVIDDRTAKALGEWLQKIPENQRKQIKTVSMDMWDPFIKACKTWIENASEKICFDRYHVAAHFNKAVNKVRSQEHKALGKTKKGSPLTKTRYDWLRTSRDIDNRTRKKFMKITRKVLKTARAWAIKEAAGMLWDYSYMGLAEKMWNRLIVRIARCRLKPMQKVGKMIKNYLWGILNAIRFRVTNAFAESMNSKIQKIKYIACGFRNRARFRYAILFHFGGLDLMPAGVRL